MRQNIDDQLRELSKDEQSFEVLKELFHDLKEEGDTFRKRLDLLESATRTDYEGILITKLDLDNPEIVYANEGICRMTGYSREELIGETPKLFQGPKTDQEVLDRLKTRLEKGQAFFGQTVNYKKDGSEFVNQWDIHPLQDKDGNVTHWVSYQHDISERKRAEKKVVDMNVEFDQLHEESKRTIIDVDLYGDIVMANKSFRELIGYQKEGLHDMKIWDLFPRKYRDSLRSRFDGGVKRENFEGRKFRGIVKHKNGFPVQVEGITRIMDLEDRTVIRGDVNNISLQKRVMDNLRRRNRDYSKIIGKASEYTYRLVERDGKLVYTYLSEGFPLFTKVSAKLVTQKDGLEELVHEEDIETAREHYHKVLSGKGHTSEYRIRTNGDFITVIDYGKPEWDEQKGEITGVTGAVSIKPAG